MVLCLGTSPVAHSVAMAAEQVIDAIEQRNAELYGGIKRPRNTRVITTSRPVVSEKVSRALLAPYEESGQILRFSDFHVSSVDVINHRVVEVSFHTSALTRSLVDESTWNQSPTHFVLAFLGKHLIAGRSSVHRTVPRTHQLVRFYDQLTRPNR